MVTLPKTTINPEHGHLQLWRWIPYHPHSLAGQLSSTYKHQEFKMRQSTNVDVYPPDIDIKSTQKYGTIHENQHFRRFFLFPHPPGPPRRGRCGPCSGRNVALRRSWWQDFVTIHSVLMVELGLLLMGFLMGNYSGL